MKARIPVLLALVLAIFIGGAWYLAPQWIRSGGPADSVATPGGQSTATPLTPEANVSPTAAATAAAPAAAMPAPDFTVDSSGLSKAQVVMNTTKGIIKYRFYSNDAPKTSARIAELIAKGFYNGLTFHRVEPGFVVQGGDPVGNGTGGSGQKLQAEFNTRKHVAGTVAMARAQDPNSADSQFYISLGTHPHLDRSYTVYGQVTEGLDVVKKITVGDKMLTVAIENN